MKKFPTSSQTLKMNLLINNTHLIAFTSTSTNYCIKKAFFFIDKGNKSDSYLGLDLIYIYDYERYIPLLITILYDQ